MSAPQFSHVRADGNLVVRKTPAFDPAQVEPVPDVVFDQSLPDDYDD